jgi:hypothetical protein
MLKDIQNIAYRKWAKEVFVGFLPDEINVEDPEERLHVVVQSNTDRLVLPLPPLPPPIESSGPLQLWSAAACVENRTYSDGVTALTDVQIQHGCSFIERAKQTPQDDSRSPLTVLNTLPTLTPGRRDEPCHFLFGVFLSVFNKAFAIRFEAFAVL